MLPPDVNAWQARLSLLPWQERVKVVANSFTSIAFSTSFSHEDQAITHAIASATLPIRLFTLDTGRLFEETHAIHAATQKAYPKLTIETYVPNALDVEELLRCQGVNGFYASVENRKACCHSRKVLPLSRALQGAEVWLSGVRAVHSQARATMPLVEWDDTHSVVKVYPLLDVSDDALQAYIAAHRVPTHPLYAKGYASIGCAPCTRPIKQGEHPRAGRWWWEQGNQECGLHVVNGKLERTHA